MNNTLSTWLQDADFGSMDEDAVQEAAITLAAALWQRSRELETRAESRQRERLSRLMADPVGQAFSTLLTDRAFRSQDTRRLARMLGQVLGELGVPAFLDLPGRLQLQAARLLQSPLHRAIAHGVQARMLAEARHVLIDADERVLCRYLEQRTRDGAKVNINHLGEAVLSEAEVARRMERYTELLRRPDVSTISVKVSSIDCRVEPLAFDATLQRLRVRLGQLYQVALDSPFRQPDGQLTPKLVNLDMESYAELAITQTLFQSVLDEPRFAGLTAGIALQAYLPDSAARQQELTEWAQARVARGGAPVRLRIVKGANLAMERVIASSRGFALPIYDSKVEVDANYKRMVEFGMQEERAHAVHLGIASHNVFDLALALVMRARHGVQRQVGLELLEGMAEPLRRTLCEVCENILIYSPIVKASEIHSGIAYLVRRLDENTTEDNFLHHSFAMTSGDAAFVRQQELFQTAYRMRRTVSSAARRKARDTSSRRRWTLLSEFQNEPDTDFSLAMERASVLSSIEKLAAIAPPHLKVTPHQGEASVPAEQGFDPSLPGVVPYTFELLNASGVEEVLATAARAHATWATTNPAQRSDLLFDVAEQLRKDRMGLLARMVIDAGKRIDQADAEISEAIDFAEYYRLSFLSLCQDESVALTGAGVTVITPPWNFPLAIAAGGTLAALMAGNAVILKPPLETPWVAHRFAELCWQAGIPRDVLQLCLCSDEVGSALIRDFRTAQVVLTGGTSTAQLFWSMRPELRLFAETGGKNAIIVSAMADRDQAIADAVTSAFGHAGQKCSAASLLICEAEVYDDPKFLQQLRETVESLPVGSAHDPKNVVTPLIAPPRGPLRQVLCEPPIEGARWLVEPRANSENPRLWSPGVLLDSPRGGFVHRTELFGPVLSVMRAKDLYEAIDIANETPYGLTSGFFSLDEREQQRFVSRMQAGNLYINRGITGAIVQRQAFGGFKASCFGPGAKAGGPNYVVQLCKATQAFRPEVSAPPSPAAATLLSQLRGHLAEVQRARLSNAACSYSEALLKYFQEPEDKSGILGEHNWHRYLPIARMVIRLEDADLLPDALLACLAALISGAGFALSVSPELMRGHAFLTELGGLPLVAESLRELQARLQGLDRIRFFGFPPLTFRAAAQDLGIHLDDSPVLESGRFELLRYLREQSIAVAYHRHGNLAGERLQRPPTDSARWFLTSA